MSNNEKPRTQRPPERVAEEDLDNLERKVLGIYKSLGSLATRFGNYLRKKPTKKQSPTPQKQKPTPTTENTRSNPNAWSENGGEHLTLPELPPKKLEQYYKTIGDRFKQRNEQRDRTMITTNSPIADTLEYVEQKDIKCPGDGTFVRSIDDKTLLFAVTDGVGGSSDQGAIASAIIQSELSREELGTSLQDAQTKDDTETALEKLDKNVRNELSNKYYSNYSHSVSQAVGTIGVIREYPNGERYVSTLHRGDTSVYLPDNEGLTYFRATGRDGDGNYVTNAYALNMENQSTESSSAEIKSYELNAEGERLFACTDGFSEQPTIDNDDNYGVRDLSNDEVAARLGASDPERAMGFFIKNAEKNDDRGGIIIDVAPVTAKKKLSNAYARAGMGFQSAKEKLASLLDTPKKRRIAYAIGGVALVGLAAYGIHEHFDGAQQITADGLPDVNNGGETALTPDTTPESPTSTTPVNPTETTSTSPDTDTPSNNWTAFIDALSGADKEAAMNATSGEGWYQTFSEMGVKNPADQQKLLATVQQDLISQGAAYKMPNGDIGISNPGALSNDTLATIFKGARSIDLL